MVDLEERLVRSFRILFSNVKEDSIIFSLKGIVYKISLFFAKKSGYLPYIFSKNEKKFNNMELDKQYQIFLKNQIHDLESNMEKMKNTSIDLILYVETQTENINKILKFVSIHNNFNLHIILTKGNFNQFESILNNLNVTKYEKIKNEKIQTKLNYIISKSKSDFMLFIDCTKGKMHNDSLYHISKCCNKDADIIYGDNDYINNKRTRPFFKPDWSPQLLLSFNYVGNFITYSISLLKAINGFDETIASYEYDLLLRATKMTNKIIHIPKILFGEFEENKKEKISEDKICLYNYLKKNKINSEITTNQGYFSIKSKNNAGPIISIIIPTKNNENILLKCIKSIQKSTYKNYEIIIINNGNKIEASIGANCKIIDYNDTFNFSKINNFALRNVKGDYILFLNDDTEVINPDWLEYMMFHATQKEVGVVGSLLLFPKSRSYPDVIQHGGVTLGTAGPAIHSFSYSHYDKHNYQELDKISRNVSAVTAACMMIRKDVFEEIAGFDERFVVVFGDIDLCLRIKDRGYQIVYCPHAKLYHAESSTRGARHPQKDEIEFLNRWEEDIIDGDKFYNPNLTHINRNFRISPHPSKIPAISLLKEIFYFRDDLKRMIPDYDYNISDVIDWAATKGVTIDIARTALVPYNKFYLNNSSKKIKKLTESIYKFNHSIELQKKFPEVFSGKYDNLISYLQIK